MGASREAFDLHNPACRRNFKRVMKYPGSVGRWSYIKLAVADTLTNACPVEEAK